MKKLLFVFCLALSLFIQAQTQLDINLKVSDLHNEYTDSTQVLLDMMQCTTLTCGPVTCKLALVPYDTEFAILHAQLITDGEIFAQPALVVKLDGQSILKSYQPHLKDFEYNYELSVTVVKE